MGFFKKLAQSLLSLSGWKKPKRRKSSSKKHRRKKTAPARKKKSRTVKKSRPVSKKKVSVKKSVKLKKAVKKTVKKASLKTKAVKKAPVVRKKTVKEKVPPKTAAVKKAKTALQEIYVGEITHYFSNAGAAAFVVEKGTLEIGNQLKFSGHTTDFSQMLFSMQVNRKPIEKAKAGDEIGIEVQKRVRTGDKVYKLVKNK